MNTLFIHTNHKQLIGAKLGKYSFERGAGPDRKFEVKFIIAEDQPEMQRFVGTEYLAGPNDLRTYTFNDLQSFTLTRLKAPELMGYSGRAVVIDPDIFALPHTNLDELFTTDLQGAEVGCVRRKNGKLESSLMLLECSKLTHWKLENILSELKQKTRTKQDFMALRFGVKTHELSEEWNSLDKLEGAKCLHTTRRITQPWKTGLRIDFTPPPLPKLFGIIPREPIHKLLGKYPTHYLPHPDKKIEEFFLQLVRDALKDGAISEQEIRDEIAAKNVRADLFEALTR